MSMVRVFLLVSQRRRRETGIAGEGAFFKPHQDTPLSDKMFGSLVVVFPTAHSGGALVLRHHGKEWTFDSAKLLHHDSDPDNRLAYVAFFSDVAHEVLPVLSGRRITVTYNLYWGRPAWPRPSAPDAARASRRG